MQRTANLKESQRMPLYNSDTSDAELVALVRQGQSQAFDLLMMRHQGRVRALIYRYVKDADEASDLAQDTFIKAYKAIQSFRGDSQFYTWIYRIAVNTAKNHLISRSRRPTTSLDDEDHDFSRNPALHDGDTPEGDLLQDELLQVIESALGDMPEQLRRALILRELEGLSYEAIAKATDAPVGTVRSRIFRARALVGKRIDPLIKT